jgi:photosystem II stability/assembly factor-like uncharacterized protein
MLILLQNKLEVFMKFLVQTLFFILIITRICLGQWYQQNSPTTQNLNAVTFIDANNGFAVGDSGIIIHTTDGGVNWTIIPSGTKLSLKDICFTNTNNGYIVGDINAWGIILRTTNGGETWWQSSIGISGGLHAICFIDSSNLWAVGWISGMEGSYQYVLKTTDGGTNWIEFINVTGPQYLNDVFFNNDGTGLAVGEIYPNGGNIIKTTDGGDSWIEIHTSSVETYYGVSGVNESTWFVVGKSDTTGGIGIVMRTTDGGATWNSAGNPPSYELNGIYFSDYKNGTVVGTMGVVGGMIPLIYRTTDSGVSWQEQLNPSQGGLLMDVFFIDALQGWAVGMNAYGGNYTIFHTTNGGVSFVEEEQVNEMPTEFLLSQNYPNPFNPSTSIQYAISSRQFVKLTVYDLLGREIETLVNEEKPVGTYELTWYAESLPSGVYFYQLKAAEFIQTKKMLLLK